MFEKRLSQKVETAFFYWFLCGPSPRALWNIQVSGGLFNF